MGFFNFSYDSVESFNTTQRQFADNLKAAEDYLTQKSQPFRVKLDSNAESAQDTSILSTFSSAVSTVASTASTVSKAIGDTIKGDEYADLRKFSPNKLAETAIIVRTLIYQTKIQLKTYSEDPTFKPFLEGALKSLEEKQTLIANYVYEKQLKPSIDKKENSDEMTSTINVDNLPLKNFQTDLVEIGKINPLFDSENLNHTNIVNFMDQYAKIYSTKLKKTEGIYVASIDPEALKRKSNKKFEGYLADRTSTYQKSVIMVGMGSKAYVTVPLETAEKQESEVPVGPTKTEALSTTMPDSEKKTTGFFDSFSKQFSSGLSAVQTATENIKQTVKTTTEKIIASNESPSKPISPSEKVEKLSNNLNALVGSAKITFDPFQINEEPEKSIASKAFLLYAQMHKISNDNQGKPITYEFFTHSSEDNMELAKLFGENPQIIPKGMMVSFIDKKSKISINNKLIMGTGVIDKDYQKTVENGLKLANKKESLNWLKNRLETLSNLEKLKTADVDEESPEKIRLRGGVEIIKNLLKKNLGSEGSGLKEEAERLYHTTLGFIESAINPLLAKEISAESANNINNACAIYMATIKTLNEPEYQNAASDLHKKTTDLLKTQLQQQENEKIKSFFGQLTLVKLSDILHREGQVSQPITDFLKTNLEDHLKILRENFIEGLATWRKEKWDEYKKTGNLPEFYVAENDQTEVAIFCRQTQNFIDEVIQPWAEVHFGGKILDEKTLHDLDKKYKLYQKLVEELPNGIPEKKAAQNLLKDVDSLRLLQRRINQANERMLENQKGNSKIIESLPIETKKNNDSLRENFTKSILEQQKSFIQKTRTILDTSNLNQLTNISNFVNIREKFTNRILNLLDKISENSSEEDFKKIRNELEAFQDFLKDLKNSIPNTSFIESKEIYRSLNALNPKTTPDELIEDTEILITSFSEFFENLENSFLEDIFTNKMEKLNDKFLSDLVELSNTNQLPFSLIEDALIGTAPKLYVMSNLPEENLQEYNNHYILKEYPRELFYIANGTAEKLIINPEDIPVFNNLLDTFSEKMHMPAVPSCPWNRDLDLLIKFTGEFAKLTTNPDIYLMDYEKILASDLTPYNGNCIASNQPVALFYIHDGQFEQLEIRYDDCKTRKDEVARNRDFVNAIDGLYEEVYAIRSPETLRALQEGEFPIAKVQRLMNRFAKEIAKKVDCYQLNDLLSSVLNTINSNPAHLAKEILTNAANEAYTHILHVNKDNPAQLKLKLSEYTEKIEKLSQCSEEVTKIMHSNLSVFDPNYDEKLQKYEKALSAYHQALEAYKLLDNKSYYGKFHNIIYKKAAEFDAQIKQNSTIFTVLSFLTLSIAYWVVSATRSIREAMTESESDSKSIPDVENNREYNLSDRSTTAEKTSVSKEALGSFSPPLQKVAEKTGEVEAENQGALTENESKKNSTTPNP